MQLVFLIFIRFTTWIDMILIETSFYDRNKKRNRQIEVGENQACYY